MQKILIKCYYNIYEGNSELTQLSSRSHFTLYISISTYVFTHERSTIRNLGQAITFYNSYLSNAYRNLCADSLSIRPYFCAYQCFALCTAESVSHDSISVWSDRWHRIRCYRKRTPLAVISLMRSNLRPTISPTPRPVLDSYSIPLHQSVMTHCLSMDSRSVENSLRFVNYLIFRHRGGEYQCLAINSLPNRSVRRFFFSMIMHQGRPW